MQSPENITEGQGISLDGLQKNINSNISENFAWVIEGYDWPKRDEIENFCNKECVWNKQDNTFYLTNFFDAQLLPSLEK